MVFFIPNLSAYTFINFTKSSSVPPKHSAKATEASFPDCIIIPFKRESIDTLSSISRNVLEPPILYDFDEILHVFEIDKFVFLILSKATYTVIILVIDAGGTLTSAFFSKRISLVSYSNTTACSALESIE